MARKRFLPKQVITMLREPESRLIDKRRMCAYSFFIKGKRGDSLLGL